MGTREFDELADGTPLLWDGNMVPNKQGIDSYGYKKNSGIEWPDGKRTEGFDDWALLHVTVMKVAA